MLKRIYLEISNICNVNCSFCPIDERGQEVMDLAQFEKIIAQAAPMAEQICLHLMGEPLAHPKFKQILSLCQKYKAKIQLTTNGLLIKKYQQLLAESDFIEQINFSLQVYADNFPNKPLVDYLRPIVEFTQYAHQIRPTLYQNYRLWNEGANSPIGNEPIYQYLERYFDIKINRKIDVAAIKSKRIWNRLYLHFDSRFEWPKLESDYLSNKGRCHGVLNHIGIHASGVVVPCCLDDKAVINLGNCLTTPLENIIGSERALAIGEGFKRGELVEDLCQRCTYIQRFSK